MLTDFFNKADVGQKLYRFKNVFVVISLTSLRQSSFKYQKKSMKYIF